MKREPIFATVAHTRGGEELDIEQLRQILNKLNSMVIQYSNSSSLNFNSCFLYRGEVLSGLHIELRDRVKGKRVKIHAEYCPPKREGYISYGGDFARVNVVASFDSRDSEVGEKEYNSLENILREWSGSVDSFQ